MGRGGEGRGFLFVQRSTSFSHELGDAFQIFCCVLLKRYFFSSSGSIARVFPTVGVLGRRIFPRSFATIHVRAPLEPRRSRHAVLRAPHKRRGRAGSLRRKCPGGLLSGFAERALCSDGRNCASKPRDDPGSASRPRNPQQKASSRLSARPPNTRDDYTLVNSKEKRTGGARHRRGARTN